MDGEGYIQCPVCGSALESVTMQEGVYDCPNCGEVEEDKDGFIVNGRFFRIDPVDRDGFGELDASDESNDFGDSEEYDEAESPKTTGQSGQYQRTGRLFQAGSRSGTPSGSVRSGGQGWQDGICQWLWRC